VSDRAVLFVFNLIETNRFTRKSGIGVFTQSGPEADIMLQRDQVRPAIL
jgi:hypothetical protein